MARCSSKTPSPGRCSWQRHDRERRHFRPPRRARRNHVLSVGGDLTNNGTLDFSTNGGACRRRHHLHGCRQQHVRRNGRDDRHPPITVNKGAYRERPRAEPVQLHVARREHRWAGRLSDVLNGTFKISGSFPMNNRTFNTAGATRSRRPGASGSTTQLHRGRNCRRAATTSNNGLFRVTQGTYNIGLTGIADQMRAAARAPSSSSKAARSTCPAVRPARRCQLTQSGGTLNVGRRRQHASRTSARSSSSAPALPALSTMSGGTINLVNPSTGSDQGRLPDQHADRATRTSRAARSCSEPRVRRPAASTTSRAGCPARSSTPRYTMRVNNATASLRGSTVTNDGVIDFTGHLLPLRLQQPDGPMTYSGTGVFGTSAAAVRRRRHQQQQPPPDHAQRTDRHQPRQPVHGRVRQQQPDHARKRRHLHDGRPDRIHRV